MKQDKNDGYKFNLNGKVEYNQANTFLQQARVGDILLFSKCDGSENNPIDCSISATQRHTFGIPISGYGFYIHAALIYAIDETSITLFHARSPSSGIGLNRYDWETFFNGNDPKTKSLALVRVPSVSDSLAKKVVEYAYNKWNGKEYALTDIDSEKTYCSRLVWDAYKSGANVDLSDSISDKIHSIAFYYLKEILPDNIDISEPLPFYEDFPCCDILPDELGVSSETEIIGFYNPNEIEKKSKFDINYCANYYEHNNLLNIPCVEDISTKVGYAVDMKLLKRSIFEVRKIRVLDVK